MSRAPHRPPNYRPRIAIKEYVQIEPALQGPDVRYISSPHSIGSRDRKLPVQLIGDLQMALHRRQPRPGLLHHSDRGGQYAATAYQQHLQAAGMMGSMSRRGNCWDNAYVESFFGMLKRELIHHRQYRSREEARQEIFDL